MLNDLNRLYADACTLFEASAYEEALLAFSEILDKDKTFICTCKHCFAFISSWAF